LAGVALATPLTLHVSAKHTKRAGSFGILPFLALA
jgi:hypothetical protein